MPQKTCPAIATTIDLPEIQAISARYGSHWQKLSKSVKWTLIGILGFQPAIFASAGFPIGALDVDILEDLEPLLAELSLSQTETGDIRFIVSELSALQEVSQAQLIAALATTIACGIYAETFADLFAGDA